MQFTLFWHAVCAFAIFQVTNSHGIDLECLNSSLPHLEEPEDLKLVLNLQPNYKLVIRYTDLIYNLTAKISESNFTDSLVVRKKHVGLDETLITAGGQNIFYTADTCSVVDTKTPFHDTYNFSSTLRLKLKNDAANMNEILRGIAGIDYKKEGSRRLVTDWSLLVDGVRTISWIGCINQTEKDNAIQIVVSFAGSKTPQTSYSEYPNPKVASVRIIVFKVNNGTNQTSVQTFEDYSLNVVELEKTKPEDKERLTRIPRGIACHNMTRKKYPTTLPTRFQAKIEYIDTDKKTTDSIDLMYDQENHVVSFALDDLDDDIPYVQNSNKDKVKGKMRVYQDFNSGFEYILSHDGHVCSQVQPIQNTWANVLVKDGILYLIDPNNAFYNPTQPPFYAGPVVEEGVTYDSYVYSKTVEGKDYVVVEFLFARPDWNGGEQKIHSIVQYHRNATHALLRKTVIRFNHLQNNTLTGTSWNTYNVRPCMHESASVDNFFYLQLSGVTMENIREYGYENVENALVEGLAKAANISVLRISQFLFKTVENELLACFLLGEKNNATPAKTSVLIKNERTIQEVRDLLNNTLQTQQMIFSVTTEDLKPVKLTITSIGLVSTKEHMQPPPYYGFSGGSMFILGIFMFMFGAGGTVGTYVLYMKRQQVRGIAYQVFE